MKDNNVNSLLHVTTMYILYYKYVLLSNTIGIVNEIKPHQLI